MHDSDLASLTLSAQRRDRVLSMLSGPPAQRTALRMVISGARSRTDIARESGLDTGTITRAVSALIDAGVLVETHDAGAVRATRGRPTRSLGIAENEHWAVGLHLGVRGVVASATGLGGSSLASVVRHHDGSEESAMLACVDGIAAMREAMTAEPLGVGIAVGGRVDSRAGRILDMPRLGWGEVPIVEHLESATGLACAVQSMAQAQARANVVYGQVGAKESFGHLYVGYIVEFCTVIRGEVWAPQHRLGGALESLMLRTDEGEIGSVRDLVSDDGIVAQAKAAGLIGADADFDAVIDPGDVDDATRDALKALLDRRARSVGDLVAQVQEVIALPRIVLSASLARQADAVDIVRARLEEIATDRTPPQIQGGGPVEVVNPRSGACGFFERLFDGGDV